MGRVWTEEQKQAMRESQRRRRERERRQRSDRGDLIEREQLEMAQLKRRGRPPDSQRLALIEDAVRQATGAEPEDPEFRAGVILYCAVANGAPDAALVRRVTGYPQEEIALAFERIRLNEIWDSECWTVGGWLEEGGAISFCLDAMAVDGRLIREAGQRNLEHQANLERALLMMTEEALVESSALATNAARGTTVNWRAVIRWDYDLKTTRRALASTL